MKPSCASLPARKLAAVSAALLPLAFSAFAFGQSETVLYRFKGASDSGHPAAGLVSDKSGNLYGTTSGSQIGDGTVFELVKPTSLGSPWTEKVIGTFGGTATGPYDALVIDKAGNLYGTTWGFGSGSVFELTPPASPGGAWTQTTLHSFEPQTGDGGGPLGGVIEDKAGNLYGTTQNGGSKCDCGIVFELSPPSGVGGPWTETILLTFNGGNGGAGPAAGLTFDGTGNLYGTTFYGGSAGFGTIFKLAPPTGPDGTWKETNLYNFTGVGDGGYPAASLVWHEGNLFGTAVGTINGDFCNPNCGVIFELSPPSAHGLPWAETTLYAFTGGSDGAAPEAPVVFDEQGNLYTTAFVGGELNNGTVVGLSPSTVQGTAWAETTLWIFKAGTDGANPSGGLIFDPAGNAYGTTQYGGESCRSDSSSYCGTVFEVKAEGLARLKERFE